jgi:hypothetical protein
MRPRILQALTWATVAAAVLSALWLAWAEAGNRNEGGPVSLAQGLRTADDGPRLGGQHRLRPQELPRPVHRSSSR